MGVNENGEMAGWYPIYNYYDGDLAYEYWEKYFKPYMQHVKEEKYQTSPWPTTGVKVYLPDGSAFILPSTWVTYFPYAKAKKNYPRSVFLFLIQPKYNRIDPMYIDWKDPKKIADNWCSKDKSSKENKGCAAVIMLNNWDIPPDYPW